MRVTRLTAEMPALQPAPERGLRSQRHKMASEPQTASEIRHTSADTYYRETEPGKVAPPSAGLIIRKSDVQIRTLADWRLYASPKGGDAQWRDYRPAKELARAWCPDGLGPTVPPETRALLASRPVFAGFSIVEALPEHHVRFDNLPGEPPTADLIALGMASDEEFVMGVVGKGDEPFGAYIGDELLAAARRMSREIPSSSYERTARLAEALFPRRIGGEPHLGELRYHLLTSLAGTLAYGSERGVRRIVFVVHEFRTHITDDSLLADNQRDLERMITRLTSGDTRYVAMNHLLGPFTLPGNEFISSDTELYIGKVRRELLALGF